MYDLKSFQTQAKNIEEWLQKEYSQIHTGRAAPALLDGVKVEVYGMVQPLKNVASITIEDPKTLRVSPWDKGQIKDIERSIYSADLGFSVVVDDSGIRVIIPPLTTETRQKLVKVAKDKLEDGRINIRKARENILSDLKSLSLPEDVNKKAKDEVQKLVDEANANLENIFKKKEQDILN